MKKLDEFSGEETGEEWLRELYKVVALRRTGMFRMITESIRMLLLGNASGVALIVGFMTVSTSTSEQPLFHWVAFATLLVFVVGTLVSAATMILVTMVNIREAHSAEVGLKRFVDQDIDRTRALFQVEEPTYRLAGAATWAGAISAAAFLLGGLCGIVLIVLFF